MKHYDVIIIGSGPAGIFAALELLKHLQNVKIMIIEKGKDIEKRVCPMKRWDTACSGCPECALLSGWGGAGAYSDGKLTLSPHIGRSLVQYIGMESLESLIQDADSTYVHYGAPDRVYGADDKEIARLSRLASENHLTFIPSTIRHIGTDRCRTVLRNIRKSLEGKLDILFQSKVKRVLTSKKKAAGILLEGVQEPRPVRPDSVRKLLVFAPAGESWFVAASRGKRMLLDIGRVDLEVRKDSAVPAAYRQAVAAHRR